MNASSGSGEWPKRNSIGEQKRKPGWTARPACKNSALAPVSCPRSNMLFRGQDTRRFGSLSRRDSLEIRMTAAGDCPPADPTPDIHARAGLRPPFGPSANVVLERKTYKEFRPIYRKQRSRQIPGARR